MTDGHLKQNSNIRLSKFNILSKLNDSPHYFIVNLLSGNADILKPEKAKEILENRLTHLDEYVEKGYLVNEAEETKQFNLKYLDFLDKRETEEIQLFFVPRYACNFSCSYCYQSEYDAPEEPLEKDVVDAFYRYIDLTFAGRRKYITIFGGEPLMNGPKAKESLQWLMDGANHRNLDVAVVTNGYHLTEYLDILSKGSIREIQVTLDGTGPTHDLRRPLKGGNPTFHKIVEGVDAALAAGFSINLRVVVDKENIDNLQDLAQLAIDKGWTTNPLFKTQLGRNYELHTCQIDQKRLFNRLELYEKIYQLINRFPQFLQFHRPAFSISRFLFDNGELPQPLFDCCPGTKTEWAFDYTGRIFSCTATVGKKDETLGTFYPEITLKEEEVELWEERDVTAINDCKKCSLQLACGGGCASVAKNQTGSLHAPDCRPVKELIEMGLPLYFKDEL